MDLVPVISTDLGLDFCIFYLFFPTGAGSVRLADAQFLSGMESLLIHSSFHVFLL